MEDCLQRVVFRAGSEAYDWADAAVGWACRGEWLSVEAGLVAGLAAEQRSEEDGEAVSESVLSAATTKFRYERGLISADETLVWLDSHGLDLEDLTRFARRSALCGRYPADPNLTREELDTTDAEFSRQLWVEAICNGALPRACFELADRVAVSASGTGRGDRKVAAAIERIHRQLGDVSVWSGLLRNRERAARVAEIEVAFEAEFEREPTPESLQNCVTTNHLDWIQIEARALHFEHEAMAREACALIREDGDDLAAVALDAKIGVDPKTYFLQQAPEALRLPFTAATVGELIGPIEIDGLFSVFQIDAKKMPNLDSPEIAERARARVWSNRVEHAVDEHIRWELTP